jgi:hypothetical protein
MKARGRKAIEIAICYISLEQLNDVDSSIIEISDELS